MHEILGDCVVERTDITAVDELRQVGACADRTSVADASGESVYLGQQALREIVSRLEADGADWALAALKSLRHVSPSALHWTLRALRRGRDLTLRQALDAEFALTRTTMAHPDFAEGVRAMVIDKDRKPVWQPARIEHVDPAMIDALFST